MGVEVVTAITVALAAYNGERYLPELLASLRGQEERDFLVLMRDDGSTDGTPGLLRRAALEDSRFQLRADGAHLGAKGSFFALMRAAETPYVALCDQDDIWRADRLSACRRAMEAAEEEHGAGTPILVHSDCSLIDGEGRALGGSFFAHQGWRGGAKSLQELLVQNNVTGCTVLMNRALYSLAAAHADPERVFMHDWFLAQTAAAFGEIVFVDAPLVAYRQHGANVLGASRGGLTGRAVRALRRGGEARARIRLTYEQAALLSASYGEALPAEARGIVQTYLDTRRKPWPLRPLRALRGGYRMQHPMARLGQFFFG